MTSPLSVPTPDPPRAPDIQYLRGEFDLGTSCVPYFSACLTGEQVVDLLKLPSQLLFDPEQIEVGELFQRELDEKRVLERIVPYLKRDLQPRFFNSLTVVLMPMDPAKPERVAETYPTDPGLAPPISAEPLEAVEVGPILLRHPKGAPEAGLLTWTRSLVEPVVLDGQHRVYAMSTIIRGLSGKLRHDLANSRIPVIFLILDRRVGFHSGGQTSVVSACREIFIALNKHAEKVPTARVRLLDDRDVHAVAMRAIVAERIEIGKTVRARVDEKPRLPLSLLDWRKDGAKFDSGPHVTTVLALYDIVAQIADVPRFDADDYKKARITIDKLEARFGLAGVPGFSGPVLKRAVQAAEEDERPFEIPTEDLKVAADHFADKFGKRIVWPLVRLTPYAELIRGLEALGILGTDLEPWLSINVEERRSLVAQLGATNPDLTDPGVEVQELVTQVKDRRYPLAFQVVFQRAIIGSLNTMVERRDVVPSSEPLGGCASEDDFIVLWIDRFNEFIAPALHTVGRSSVFFGAGIKVDGTVDFRKSRVKSISGFISYAMLAPLENWIRDWKGDQDGTREEIHEWIASQWGLIQPARRRGLAALYADQGKLWQKNLDELSAARNDAGDYADLEKDEQERVQLELGVDQFARLVALHADSTS